MSPHDPPAPPMLHACRVPALLTLLAVTGCSHSTAPAEATDPDPALDARIDGLIAQMTLDEKIGMIHANSAWTTAGVPRLGVPGFVMSDGPHGVRHEHTDYYDKATGARDSSTYLPVGTALAATWNEGLGYQFGYVLGREAAWRGKDIILGPGVNIIRDPLNGRNFEYLTEDPYLNSRMAVGYVRGVQDQGVATSVKHYIANSLEYERQKVDVRMDDRTFREIYLPAFKAAVQEGGALTVMGAYNKFRGEWASQNDYLLNTVLKDELGFQGLVMSDWSAVNNTLAAATGGLDIEMGTDLTQEWQNPDYDAYFMADPLEEMVQNGTVPEATIDDKVRRILRVMDATHMLSGDRPRGAYHTPEHIGIAKDIAREAIVLLKNDGLLPLRRGEVRTLAVIGANADREHAGGGGSSQVKAFYEVTALEGLRALLGDAVEVTYAPGYRIAPEATADPDLIAEAVRAASGADAVVFVGGLIHGYSDLWEDNAYDTEVKDKPDMMLPFGQDALIEAVLAANPRTVVALQSGGPVDMRAWAPEAPAIVQAWYAGMEGGTALAEILFGEVNPSGKLPMTFPRALDESPTHVLAQYPDERLVIDHTEGLFVGYRYFDSYGVEPAFAFGHGLSYTTFAFSGVSAEKRGDRVRVRVTVTNTGDRAGKETVQVYVHDQESALERPEKELKAFAKVDLAPGESETVTLELGRDAFSYYDPARPGWVLEPGAFTVLVGASSRDVRGRAEVTW